MAKKSINSAPGKKAREKRIAECQQCNGAPPKVHCVLQGLHFDKCDLCMEIVGEYHKEGSPIVITEKKAVALSHVDPNYNGRDATQDIKIIPGKNLNFNDLIE